MTLPGLSPRVELLSAVVVEGLPQVGVERLPQVGVERLPQVGVERLPQVGVERLPPAGVEGLPQVVELLPLGVVELLATRYNYVAVFLLLAIGLYMMIATRNLVKKVIGMNVFQVAIFLFFVTAGFVRGGRPPVVHGGEPGTHASPLPHVLILTAIVVGVSLTAVALALVVRIYAEYGTLDEAAIREVRANE